MNKLPMHNALKTIAWLEGTWRTKDPGQGEFPIIKSFIYHEEIKFTSIGQPMFNYEAQSWHPDTKNPMHREVGFLKIIPNSNDVKLVLSHNFGLASIEEGQIDDENHREIILNSSEIVRMSGAAVKHPHVTKVFIYFIQYVNK